MQIAATFNQQIPLKPMQNKSKNQQTSLQPMQITQQKQ